MVTPDGEVGGLTARRADSTELPAALAVWHAANQARGKFPDAARVARVRA